PIPLFRYKAASCAISWRPRRRTTTPDSSAIDRVHHTLDTANRCVSHTHTVKPAPETSRALEAEAREALQRRADEAIYARRNAAVTEERLIKESELNTEIAVE